MQISAKDLAKLLNGTIEGDPNVLVNAPSKIEEGKKGTISFYANAKYEPYVYTSEASILLVSNTFEPKEKVAATLIRVEDVYASIGFLLNKFGEQQEQLNGIATEAAIHESAKLGKNVAVGIYTVIEKSVSVGAGTKLYPQVYLGANVQVGKNCILYPGVRIYHDCVIGDNCILHANVVIGGDGFGFAPQEDGSYQKIAQIGNVIIENDVEIGANSTIDRATMGSTIIRQGVKLDNLVMIAHNVEVGKDTVIAAQAGVAGSTKLGARMQIGGQAGFAGHLKIADGVKFQAQSGVSKSVREEDSAWFGSPAIPYRDYVRSYAVFKNLPDLARKIHQLEKELKNIKEE